MAPGNFAVPRPMRAAYDFGWSGVTAGHGVFDLTQPKEPELRLAASIKTVGLPRRLWRLDATQTAVADARRLRPLWLNQTEIYRSRTLDTRLTFAPESVVRQTRDHPEQTDFMPAKKFKFSEVLDMFTTVLMVRSHPLRVGDTLRFVVFPSTSAFLAEARVVGREKITVPSGTHDAIKLDLRLKKIGKKGELEPHAKFSSGAIWLSDDRDRIVLRAAVEVFVGSVWAELRSVEFAGPPAQ